MWVGVEQLDENDEEILEVSVEVCLQVAGQLHQKTTTRRFLFYHYLQQEVMFSNIDFYIK